MTMQPAAPMDVTTLREGVVARCSDLLVREVRRTFRVNGEILATAVCTPGDARHHGLGFLLTEGYLVPGELLLDLTVDGEDVTATLDHPAAPCPPEPVTSDLVVPIAETLEIAATAASLVKLHPATGGTHSAAVFVGGTPGTLAEDISRSAAFERAVGAAAAAGIPLDRRVLYLSSRVPEAFVIKAARVRIPILAAVSAPTFQAAERAEQLGICLCAFVRGSRANVYSCPWRVGL